MDTKTQKVMLSDILTASGRPQVNGQAVDIAPLEKIGKRELPFELAYSVAYNKRQLKKITETYEETYKAMLGKYARTDDKGELVPREDNTIDWYAETGERDFTREHRDFMKTAEVEVRLNMIKMSAFKNRKGKVDDVQEESMRLTPDEIEGILFMIEGDNDNAHIDIPKP